MLAFLAIVFRLMIGHAVADFPLQPEAMARGKNPRTPIDLSKVPAGQRPVRVWWHYVTAHALIHAGAVWGATGSMALALLELIAHWAIDYGKCTLGYSPHVDQALHVACKLFWAVLAVTVIS